MRNLSRREFMMTASLAASTGFAAPANRPRVLVGSGTANGILAYDWNAATGELVAAGVAAKIDTVDWINYSHGNKFIYAACEFETFKGKPTGEVAGFSVSNGTLQQISADNSAATGTCHVGLD